MQDGVQSIRRAVAILRALEHFSDGLPLGDLAAAAGLAKSTTHRIASALAAEGLLASEEGRLRLGGELARLGAAVSETLRDDVRPVLERLNAELDETVDLAVLDGGNARFIDQIAATHRLRAASAVGLRFPLHCTANGKAMLAALERERALARLPARLPRLTSNTITTHKALIAELDRIRAQGIAYDDQEHTDGICAVGAAVYDATGLAGAISIPVPMPRFKGHEQRYASAIRAAACEASRRARGLPAHR